MRWYLRYGLSYRDVEELLAERGIEVDHVTIYRWVQRFTPLAIEAARPCRHSVGDRWFVDETYVKVADVWWYVYRKVADVWWYVYRAVDQYGQVIDVYVPKRRNVAAATRFSETMLAGRERTREITTDLAAPLPRVVDELLLDALHDTTAVRRPCVSIWYTVTPLVGHGDLARCRGPPWSTRSCTGGDHDGCGRF